MASTFIGRGFTKHLRSKCLRGLQNTLVSPAPRVYAAVRSFSSVAPPVKETLSEIRRFPPPSGATSEAEKGVAMDDSLTNLLYGPNGCCCASPDDKFALIKAHVVSIIRNIPVDDVWGLFFDIGVSLFQTGGTILSILAVSHFLLQTKDALVERTAEMEKREAKFRSESQSTSIDFAIKMSMLRNFILGFHGQEMRRVHVTQTYDAIIFVLAAKDQVKAGLVLLLIKLAITRIVEQINAERRRQCLEMIADDLELFYKGKLTTVKSKDCKCKKETRNSVSLRKKRRSLQIRRLNKTAKGKK